MKTLYRGISGQKIELGVLLDKASGARLEDESESIEVSVSVDGGAFGAGAGTLGQDAALRITYALDDAEVAGHTLAVVVDHAEAVAPLVAEFAVRQIRTWYIDESAGSDSNSGAMRAAALATAAEAISRSIPGDVLHIIGTVTSTVTLSSAPGRTLTGDPGAAISVTSGNGVALGHYTTVRGLSITTTDSTGIGITGITAVRPVLEDLVVNGVMDGIHLGSSFGAIIRRVQSHGKWDGINLSVAKGFLCEQFSFTTDGTQTDEEVRGVLIVGSRATGRFVNGEIVATRTASSEHRTLALAIGESASALHTVAFENVLLRAVVNASAGTADAVGVGAQLDDTAKFHVALRACTVEARHDNGGDAYTIRAQNDGTACTLLQTTADRTQFNGAANIRDLDSIDLPGKVLGGGSGTIEGVGAWADNRTGEIIPSDTVRATTPANTLNIDASGRAKTDVERWRNVEPQLLTNGYVQGSLEQWRGTQPNNLTGGNVMTDVRAVNGTAVTSPNDFKADVSGLAEPGDEMNLADGAITSSKIANGAFTAAKFASDFFTAVFTATIGVATSALTTADTLGKLFVDMLNATVGSRAEPGDQMDLVNAPNATAMAALAIAVEAELVNDATGDDLKQQIADKIVENLPDLESLEVEAIAQAARDAILDRVLAGNHDTPNTAGKLMQDTATAAAAAQTAAESVDGKALVETSHLPDNFGALLINASGHLIRVVLVDTTTANTDMRGTDGALLDSGYTAPDNAGIADAKAAAESVDGKLTTDRAAKLDRDLAHAADADTYKASGFATPGDVTAARDAVLTGINDQERLKFGDTLPGAPDPNTVAEALLAARAQGFGRWVIDQEALTLTLYGPDDETPLRVFDLAPSLAKPLSRTPQ